MQHFLAIIEKALNNYSGFFPDVPGCIAAGTTVDETLQLLQEALEFHFEGMTEDGDDLPQPRGFLYHYQNGTFNEDEIGETYLIANVSIPEQKIAA